MFERYFSQRRNIVIFFAVNGPANVPNQNQYGRPMPNQAQYVPQSNYPTPPSPHMHAPYKPGTFR